MYSPAFFNYLLFAIVALSFFSAPAQRPIDQDFKVIGYGHHATQQDSLIALLPEVSSKNKAELLCLISRSYRENNAQAIEFTKKSIEQIEALKDSTALARIYEILGHTLNVHGNYKAASRYFSNALKILDERKDELSMARKFHLMAYASALGNSNSYEGVIHYLSKSNELFQGIKNKEGMAYTTYGLGQTLLSMIEENKSSPQADSILLQSLHYSQLSEQYAKQAGLKDRMAAAIVSQSEVYNLLKQSKRAKLLLKTAYAIHKQENMLLGMSRCMWNLSEIYMGQHQTDSAIFCLKESAAFLEKMKINSFLVANYDGQTELYKMKGDYNQALKTSEVARTYREKSFEEQFNAEIAEIRNNYENQNPFRFHSLDINHQLKDGKIQDLETIALLDKAESTQERLVFIVVSIGLLMVLTLVMIIFRNRQRYQKQLKEIELNAKIRQEKERIAQDLHDNIGTQLTMVASGLNKLSREPIFNSDQVKHLHQNMNATLVELRDTIWAINKDEVSLEEIENRINNLFWRLRQNDDSVNFQLKTIGNAAKQKLSPAEAVNLFRIIQEAINNSLKHSKATEVTVILERKSNQLHLTVSDNGVGFQIEETEQIEHYGMGNMKKRAKEINAYFSLTSEPGTGTLIQLQLNLLQSE